MFFSAPLAEHRAHLQAPKPAATQRDTPAITAEVAALVNRQIGSHMDPHLPLKNSGLGVVELCAALSLSTRIACNLDFLPPQCCSAEQAPGQNRTACQKTGVPLPLFCRLINLSVDWMAPQLNSPDRS